jgi:hypothetical protein
MTDQHAISLLIGEYPSLWDVMDVCDKSTRGQRNIRRYPLAIGVLSTAMEFHDWTRNTCQTMALRLNATPSWVGLPVPSGPDPRILERLVWMDSVWVSVDQTDPHLAKNVAQSAERWHRRIINHVGAPKALVYLQNSRCPKCELATVMREGGTLLCVNVLCRDGDEWHTWAAFNA